MQNHYKNVLIPSVSIQQLIFPFFLGIVTGYYFSHPHVPQKVAMNFFFFSILIMFHNILIYNSVKKQHSDACKFIYKLSILDIQLFHDLLFYAY